MIVVKRSRFLILILSAILIVSISFGDVLAAKPPRTQLSVTISSPQDGTEVEEGSSFTVDGAVLAKRGDAGFVETFVQYAVGEGSTDFVNVDGIGLQIESGNQPQTETLQKDESYAVSWILSGNPGIYEVRIYSQGSTAKSGSSESRTVTIIPETSSEIELVDREYVDSSIGYGSATGMYSDTFYSDDLYEVLSEGVNKQGTKSPDDDTSELGWIFEFNDLPIRLDTNLYIECRAEFPRRETYYEGFAVQIEYQGMWFDVARISDETPDKVYSAELPDDGCQSIRVRVVDHDRTVGDRVKSSLYIDQLYLDISGSQVINPGVELLFGGNRFDYTVSTWELASDTWYSDRSFPLKYYGEGDHTGYAGVGEILVIDVDGDGKNEAITGGQYTQIFEWINGAMIPTYTIVQPGTGPKSIKSIAAADLDGTGGTDLELLVSSLNWDIHTSIFKKIGEVYVPIFNISSDYRREVGGCVCAVGDVDGNGDLEFIVVEEFPTSNLDDGLLLLRLFDYQGDTWQEIADYSFELGVQNWIDSAQILDLDNDGVDEIFIHHRNNPPKILEYSNGQLSKIWEAPRLAMAAKAGNMRNNGEIQIVAAGSLGPEIGVGFNVYEYVDGAFKNTFNFSSPAFQGCAYDGLELGDVDGDGQNELVFLYVIDVNSPLQNTMFSIFRNAELVFTGDTGYGTSEVVAIGDYDNDAT
ncbi:MAG: FG-GAP repeat domain-containing protein [Candidatus Hermodarchaeota archaeon]